MELKHIHPRIFFPKSIAEALELTRSEPDGVFWSGGTGIVGLQEGIGNSLPLPRVVISLGMVEELARASRSEHSLEIGSMMTLDRLASIGRSVLPVGLSDALSAIGSKPLRCRATLGGHLALTDRVGDLIPLLQLMETSVEIRGLKSRKGRRRPSPISRKTSLAELIDSGGPASGELITRVSIPLGQWDIADYHRIPPMGERSGNMIFAVLARRGKGVMDDWRMALSDGSGLVLRNREMEANMAGRSFPLSEKELEALDEAVDIMTASWAGRSYDRTTAKCLARGFWRSGAV